MAVRFKLDRCGIKLTLKQWNQLTPAGRKELLTTACDTDGAVDAYRERLARLVALRNSGTLKPLPGPPDATWAQTDAPPAPVVAFAASHGVSAPMPDQWRALSELERFVLVKLSRDNHDNVNFMPALREFGLLSERRRPVRTS
jgi:hypothetical protein